MRRKSRKRKQSPSIARRMIIYIVLLSSSITLVTTFIQLYLDYEKDVGQIHDLMYQIEHTHLASIRSALWTFDREQLDVLLNGIQRQRDMEYLEVTKEGKIVSFAGFSKNTNIISRRFSIYRLYEGKQLKLGTLRVVASLEKIYNRLLEKVFVILLSNGIKTFTVAIFIFFIFQRLVTNHLTSISRYVLHLKNDLFLQQPLTLKRDIKEGEDRDELDHVVYAINDMRINLQESYRTLEKTQIHLQAILDFAPALISIRSLDGRLILANKKFNHLAGPLLDDVKSRTDQPQENATKGLGNRESFTSDNEKIIETEEIYLHEDGSRHTYLAIRFPLYDKTGQAFGICEISTDITERKQAEESLRHLQNYLSNIINSMPSALIGVDIEGKVTQWNKIAEQMTGISSEIAQGKNLSIVFPRMSMEMGEIDECIQSREMKQVRKKPHQKEDNIRYEDVTVYPLTANGVEGAVIRIDDVTDVVRMEEMMVQTEKMMSVGGLAAGMAHEINNPLGAILQASQNMRRRFSPELKKNWLSADKYHIDLKNLQLYMEDRDILTFLDTVHESGVRAAKIIADMLQFSRKSESKREPVDIVRLLENAIELASKDYDLKNKHDFRHISIVRDFAPDLKPVPCIENEIEQVFLNLLKNAAQAMPKKDRDTSPQITLRVMLDGNMARIEIQDNGTGMEEKIKKRVFEPFFTTKGVGKGTGLGLSVSYMIVTTNHKGTIAVDSELGAGTKFTVRLPFKDESDL